MSPAISVASPAYGSDAPRKQEIHTPEWVWSVAQNSFGGRVSLDPCASSDPGYHFAKHNVLEERDGLKRIWVGTTYVNPPYKYLKNWLLKIQKEADRGTPIIALYPVRPHRQWWTDVTMGCTESYFLKPVVFEGYKATFPIPCVLSSWNVSLCIPLDKITGRLR